MPTRACRSLIPSSGGSSLPSRTMSLDDGDARRQSVAARRLQRLGIAEVGDGPVALELGDDPAVRRHDRRDAVLVRVQHVVPILGIERGRQLGRADEVREHHRQLAPLRGVGRTGHRRRPRSSSAAGPRPDPNTPSHAANRRLPRPAVVPNRGTWGEKSRSEPQDADEVDQGPARDVAMSQAAPCIRRLAGSP